MSIPTQTTGWNSGGANRVDPGSSKKTLGWVTDEQPASSTFNWLFWIIENWLVWLSGIYGYATTWTNAHVFQVGVSFNAAAQVFGVFGTSEAVRLGGIADGATGANAMPDNACPTFVYRSTGACIATLPVTPVGGQLHFFKNMSTGTLEVIPPSGQFLDGSGSGVTLTNPYTAMIVQWDSLTGWMILAKFGT